MTEEIKKPFYKKWWFWTIIALLLVAGFAGNRGDTEERLNNKPQQDTSAPSDGENIKEKEAEVSDNVSPETEIKRVVMVDTISRWNDVDEVSLSVNQNLGDTYTGDYIVIVSANYNGDGTRLSESLLRYCNKLSSALDNSKIPISEFMISWTVPSVSSQVIGKCHYHNQDGILIYDHESMGILVNK